MKRLLKLVTITKAHCHVATEQWFRKQILSSLTFSWWRRTLCTVPSTRLSKLIHWKHRRSKMRQNSVHTMLRETDLDNKSIIGMSKVKTRRIKCQLKSVHVWYADSLVVSAHMTQPTAILWYPWTNINNNMARCREKRNTTDDTKTNSPLTAVL